MMAKINAAIVKAGDTKEVRIGLTSLLAKKEKRSFRRRLQVSTRRRIHCFAFQNRVGTPCNEFLIGSLCRPAQTSPRPHPPLLAASSEYVGSASSHFTSPEGP
jgi:hypothetical protein